MSNEGIRTICIFHTFTTINYGKSPPLIITISSLVIGDKLFTLKDLIFFIIYWCLIIFITLSLLQIANLLLIA